MLISYNWLREWVGDAPEIGRLADMLTMGGLEVAAVTPAGPALDARIVVGKIVECAAHPNAGLRVCEVHIGGGVGGGDGSGNTTRRIVCGAANATAGVCAAVALPGARLPGMKDEGEGAEIRARKIAGVESEGMLCSAAELGLESGGGDADGILLLDADAKVGAAVAVHLDLGDSVLEIELTPNRGDCLSVLGIAREVCALSAATPMPKMAWTPAAGITPAKVSCDAKLPIELRAPQNCPRYVGRAVCDANVAALTPDWMRERLRRCGVRPINIAVDITNYVMLELGQPMHAFDLDKLRGGIVVRLAAAGEKLQLLDGNEAELRADDLVIADHEGAVALGGIMGGQESAIGDATRNIYFEAAYFSPAQLQGKARRLAMHTDASHRFERGVDAGMQAAAMARATQLTLALAGGAAGPLCDAKVQTALPRRPTIHLRRAEIARQLGVEVADAAAMLAGLGMEVTARGDGWRVRVPGWRPDIGGAHDLVEEVGRVYGFERIPPRVPVVAAAAARGRAAETRIALPAVKAKLLARGYFEAVTYSFVDAEVQRALTGAEGLALANPIAANMAVMRRSLLPGLLQAVRTNLNRRHERVRLFEVGRVFLADAKADGGRREVQRIGGVVSGDALPVQWAAATRPADFYDVKGDLESLLALSAAEFRFQPSATPHPALHPGRGACITVDGEAVGHIGQLHPAHQKRLDIEQPVFCFELDCDAVGDAALPRFAKISPYPAVRRDLAIVLQSDVAAAEVLAAAREAGGELLVDCALFDVYAGASLAAGEKSFALRLTFQSESGNLTAGDGDAMTARIVSSLQQRFAARLRDK